MKIKRPISLLALGMALIATTSRAQTTPTGTATSTTYPQGAIAPDSMPAKPSRDQKRAMKRNRRMTNQKAGNTGTTNTSPQDAHYRRSSTSEGTAINNSNTTNYNSNNVTNAPTGAGRQSERYRQPTATRPSSGRGQYPRSTRMADSNAGTAAAVSGAKTSRSAGRESRQHGSQYQHRRFHLVVAQLHNPAKRPAIGRYVGNPQRQRPLHPLCTNQCRL